MNNEKDIYGALKRIAKELNLIRLALEDLVNIETNALLECQTAFVTNINASSDWDADESAN